MLYNILFTSSFISTLNSVIDIVIISFSPAYFSDQDSIKISYKIKLLLYDYKLLIHILFIQNLLIVLIFNIGFKCNVVMLKIFIF